MLERLSRPADPVPASKEKPPPSSSADQWRSAFVAQSQAPVPTEIAEMNAEGERLADELAQSMPDCAEGLCFAGRMHRSFRDSKKATQCWEKCLQLAPDVSDPHFCLGAVAWEQGEYEKAVAYLRQAVKLGPDLTNAFMFLGSSLLNLGKPEEAIAAMQSAPPEVQKTPEVQMVLGQSHLDLHNYDKAKQHFEAVLAANKGLWNAHYGLMTAYMRTRQPEKAREHQKAYQKLVDDDRKTQAAAASVEAHKAELRNATANLYLSAGQIGMKHGRPDLAGRYWARAILFAPDDPRPKRHLESLCDQLAKRGLAPSP